MATIFEAAVIYILTIPALLISALVLLNLLTWRRPRPSAKDITGVSILIPARNEEENIAQALAAATKTSALEILVLDDHSTDNTASLIDKASQSDPRVRRLSSKPLPQGWVGKVHACHQLAQQATGSILLFIDADVQVSKDALSVVDDALRAQNVDVLTALPRQSTGSFWEHLVIPLLHLTYLSWLWLPAVKLLSDPRMCAANGQFLATTPKALSTIGGFEATKNEIVDDVALCRSAKSAGLTVEFIDGFHLAACRMYRNRSGVFDGFSKNLYAGVGATPIALGIVFMLYAWVYVVPIGAAISVAVPPLVSQPTTFLPLVAASSVVCTRLLISIRFKLSLLSVLLHPLTILVFFIIGSRSLFLYRAQKIQWRGRTYAP